MTTLAAISKYWKQKSHESLYTIHGELPRLSGSALDCWPPDRANDPRSIYILFPGAWFVHPVSSGQTAFVTECTWIIAQLIFIEICENILFCKMKFRVGDRRDTATGRFRHSAITFFPSEYTPQYLALSLQFMKNYFYYKCDCFEGNSLILSVLSNLFK